MVAAGPRASPASSASPRGDQDAWAYALAPAGGEGQDAGFFDDEIVAVGEVTADESIRRDTSLEKLASLRPAMDPEGTITAGNAPGVNDGASMRRRLLRGVREAPRPGAARNGGRTGLRRRRVRVARAPAPANAGAQALEKAGKSIGDVQRVEVNEAFSSVALNSIAMPRRRS